MVQPRNQQVKDVQTRHSKLEFSPSQGSPLTSISSAVMNSFVISDTPGGAEEDITAQLISPNIEPYPILGGDAFNIAIDGGPSNLVTFSAGDTTASRVAARINAAVGSPVAGNDVGFLFIQSILTGSISQIVVSDSVPGTLSKFGFVAGTTIGVNKPGFGSGNSGIITRSQDRLGGYVVLRTNDGKNVVTNGDFLAQVNQNIGPTQREIGTPGGLPIHGRLTYNSISTNYTLKYFARGPTRSEIITFNSNFSLLDGTNSISLTLGTFFPMVVSFGAGPGLTRDQVIDIINQAWAAFAGAADGHAHVLGALTQPFSLGGKQFGIAVDGGPLQVVTLSFPSLVTSLIAADINAQVIGVTASDVGGKLLVASNNTNGRISSLEFRDPRLNTFYDSTSVLAQLGIAEGIYRGYFIAEPYGPAEIAISGLGAGASSSITSSSSVSTQARMGIPDGIYAGVADGEISAKLPSFVANVSTVLSFPSTDPYSLAALIPELLEFGEVEPAIESVLQQFGDKSAGSNVDPSTDLFVYEGTDAPTIGGIEGAGKPVLTDPQGQIHIKFLENAIRRSQAFFSQFIIGDFGFGTETVLGLAAAGIGTPGTSGNPRPKSPTFTVDIDTDNTFNGTRQFIVVFRSSATPRTPFRVVDSDLITGLPAGAGAVDLGGSAVLGNSSAQLGIYDGNTLSAGIASGGRGYMFFSAEDYTVGVEGDKYLRIFDKDVSGIPTVLGAPFRRTILKRLNSIEVSCGDGTVSFGDFNGPNAIQQAISYASVNVLAFWSLTIRVKRGTYTSFSDISVPIFCRLILIGDDCGPSFINPGTNIFAAPGAKIIQLLGATYFEARNIRFGTNAAGIAALIEGVAGSDGIVLKDCFLNGTALHLLNHNKLILERCIGFTSSATASPIFRLDVSSNSGGLVARNCVFNPPDNNPVLRITSVGGVGARTGRIFFDECNLNLASTTVNGQNNMIGNCGAVDLDPGTFDGLVAGAGAIVDEIAFHDCTVNANQSFGAVSCLLHLIPCANASRTNASPFIEGTHKGMKVLKLTIKGGTWSVPRTATSVNPFTVGLAWVGGSNLPRGGEVTLKDVNFEFDQTGSTTFNMGSSSQDVGSFFGNTIVGSSAPAQSIWGAFAIAANTLSMSGVRFRGLCQQGGCGDLFIKANNYVTIDDVCVEEYVLGTVGSVPDNRARFRFGGTISIVQASIKNLRMLGDIAGVGSWVPDDKDIIAHEPSVTPVVYEDCKVEFYSQPVGTLNAFTIVDLAPGSLYSGSVGFLSSFRLSKLTVLGLGRGFKGAFSNLLGIGVWTIEDCLFGGTSTVSLLIVTIGIDLGILYTKGNTIRSGGVNPGLSIRSDSWDADTLASSSYAMVTNNNVAENGVNSGTQIEMLAIGGVGASTPHGVIHGNICGKTAAAVFGKIKVSRWNGAAQVALLSGAAPSTTPIVGIETSYDATISAASTKFRNYEPANPMMLFNIAGLETP